MKDKIITDDINNAEKNAEEAVSTSETGEINKENSSIAENNGGENEIAETENTAAESVTDTESTDKNADENAENAEESVTDTESTDKNADENAENAEESVTDTESTDENAENANDVKENADESANENAESTENSDENAENSDENAESENAEEFDNGGEETEEFAPFGDDTEEFAPPEEEAEKKKRFAGLKRFFTSKKTWIITGIVFAILVCTYFGGVLYYRNHFFFGTKIQGYSCANMTPQQAEDTIKNAINDYSYTIYETNGKSEIIKGSDVDLKIESIGSAAEQKEKQNPFEWLTDRANRKLSLDISISLNEDKLYNILAGFDCIAETKRNMEGAAALVVYQADNTFSVPNDPSQNIVSLNMLFEKAKAGMYGLYGDMDLSKEGCYVEKAQEDHLRIALDTMNKYVATKVTYQNGDTSTMLDGSTIHPWVTLSDDYTVSLDAAAVEGWVENLASSYNTVGMARSFVTSGGSTITVSGGDYGWWVNTGAEAEALCDIIKNGEETSREPIYRQTAASHGSSDLGNTYVEISISGQHLWYYAGGELIVSSDFVSGDPTKGYGTPTGVYSITYKERNATLKGQGYSSPVSYWMPFNGGIGLHDASWRSSFGGSIYNGSGSHGCINLPTDVAATIYGSISSGDPVIVY